MKKNHQPGNMIRAFQAKKKDSGLRRKESGVMPGKPASNVISGSGGAYVRNYAGFTPKQANTISGGLKNGTVRGEPNKYGGEYIAKAVKSNPNSPANYGKAMSSAYANTKVFRKSSKKRKAASSIVAPESFGKKQQQAYAGKFGLPVQTSTRTRTKRKVSKLDRDMAFKKKRKSSAKKKAMMGCA